MAVLPVIADTYRCALEWQNSDHPDWVATNVIHVHKSSSNPAAIATILDNAATPNMWRAQGSHSKVGQINVTPLDGSSVTYPYPPATPAHWVGTQTANTPVPNVTNLVKLLTSKRGRSFRGRVFLPWTDEAAINGNLLDTGFAALITTAWVAFHTALTAATTDLVVASYVLAQQNAVAALASETSIGTMRRRLARNSQTG
jgi:hypothetical protein